ncbi:MAG: InlB B-repeat-containing protein [Paludibacteraceae bacterium]|nr:InlB B-repeat-containing protein [Paludibacteraceae bacterium]MBQ8704729.1 InlB B-repeat-containing protein [Paludibacteraceae bacterium]
MKHRFFLLILAAFMSTTYAWAQCPQYFYDTIPAQRYISDFEIVWENNKGGGYELPYLKFVDTFRPDLQLDRKYNITLYARHTNDLTNGCKFRYITQADEPGSNMHWDKYEYWYSLSDINLGLGAHVENRVLSSGGDVVHQGLYTWLHFAVEKGVKELIFFVNPQYKDVNAVTGETKYVSFYGDAGGRRRDYNINYFTYTLPNIVENTLSAPNEVKSGEKLLIKADIQAIGSVTYKLQERSTGNWRTIQSGSISTSEARAGKTIQYEEEFGNGHAATCEYRLIATDVATAKADTSNTQQVQFLYKEIFNNNITYRSAGETFYSYKAEDCMVYKVTSDLTVPQKIEGDMIKWTMPACDVTIVYEQPTYTVKFWNSDLTLLKTEEVVCGGDATAPAEPTIQNLIFDHWSADFTNVHRNLNIYARYTMAGNYSFDAAQIAHTNKLYPADGFTGSETRAMMGDSITFWASLATPSASRLYFQTARRNAQGEWDWNGATQVGEFTDADVAAGKAKEFTKTVPVFYNYYNEQYLEQGFAFRFMVNCGGENIYSEVYEYDVYYPLYINSLIDDGGMYETLMVENTAHDIAQGAENILIPARYQDTIRIYRLNGGAGACMNFARVNKPQSMYALEDGLDEEGNAYVIAPGEKETLNVDVAKVAVVFDGAAPITKYDFTAQGVGYKGNAYYAEVVNCGGAIQNIPADPANGQQTLFIGWEAWGDYDNDAYLNVPATGDSYIGFTAMWEDIPDAPTYTVIFFDKDGNILSTQEVKEGENAVPPVAPEVAGFHFVGWDSPYTTITNDKDITAVYGEDSKTWTVTYLNWDNSPLGTEQVNDGEAAQGVIATRTGYTFVGWSEDISSVKSDMTVTALFDVSVFTITYTIDGVKIMSEQVAYGAMPAAYQSVEDQGKPATEQYVYTFSHWTPAIVPAVADATYEAVFTPSPRKYLVTFQNWDHSFLAEQQVEYGKAATAPADPTREGYTFKGWDREFNHIIADMTVTALFEKSKGQGIENTPSPSWGESERGCKLLLDGNLYIIRPDGTLYNAQGAKVK